jgi:RHS repeat-associated protein
VPPRHTRTAETGSTNPSAPTSIGSGSLTYDTNGNLTAYNATKYTWDYRNRVTAIGNGTATTTFAYDHTFERVKKVSGGVSTYYINDLYNKAGATTTIYIYDNTGTLIATIEGNGTATTTEYQHQDHLGGTQILTSAYGNVVSTLDYYPYGDTRIQSGTFTSKRNFIGEVQDLETDLNYLNARYYDSGRGQFLSQDPVFWEVGESEEGMFVLISPQLQNSYSYGVNNPIANKDADGRCPLCLVVIDTLISLFSPSVAYAPNEGEEEYSNQGLEAGVFMMSFVTPYGGAKGATNGVINSTVRSGVNTEVRTIAKNTNWGNPNTLAKHTSDHAADFNLSKTDTAGYARAANSFITKASKGVERGSGRYDTFIGGSGKTYFFDKKTGTFGVRNKNGSVATAYKPKGGDQKKAQKYWIDKKKE